MTIRSRPRATASIAALLVLVGLIGGCSRKSSSPAAGKAAIPAPAPIDTLAPGTIRGSEPMPASEDVAFLKSLPESSAVAHLNLGDLYLKQGKKPEAIEEYRKAVTLRPRYPQAWNNLGLAYQRSGDTLAAEKSYKEAIAADGRFAKAYCNLGVLCLRRNQNAEGLKWLKQAVKADSTDPIVCSNLGHAYRRMGDDNNAIEYYTRAIKLDPTRGIDHFHIANIYYEKLLWDDAYERYRMALELDPTIDEARRVMKSMEEHNVLTRNKPKNP